MTDPLQIATEILNDTNLAVSLFAQISANIAASKGVLSASSDPTVAGQIAEAKAKLAAIQASAAQADADFDAALAASQA